MNILVEPQGDGDVLAGLVNAVILSIPFWALVLLVVMWLKGCL